MDGNGFDIGTDVPCMCAAWGDVSEIVDVSEEMKGIALSNAELVQCALQVLLTRTCSVQVVGRCASITARRLRCHNSRCII